MKKPDLVIHISSPKPGCSPIIGIRGKNPGLRGPDFINILNNDERFTDDPVAMNENRDFLVDRIGSQKKIALSRKVLWYGLAVDPLDVECDFGPQHKRAYPRT